MTLGEKRTHLIDRVNTIDNKQTLDMLEDVLS